MNFFCQHVFLFCATLNIFSQHESLFLASHNFFCCNNIFFCDSHNFCGQRNFYVKYFLLLTQNIVSCATQHFFVQHVQNVRLKNIVNKEKQVSSYEENLKTSCCSPPSGLTFSFREIKCEYHLKA